MIGLQEASYQQTRTVRARHYYSVLLTLNYMNEYRLLREVSY